MFNCFSRASAPLPCARPCPPPSEQKWQRLRCSMRFSCHHSSSRTDRPMQNQCRRIVAAPCAARYMIAQHRNATAALKDALPMAISAAFSSAAVVFRPRAPERYRPPGRPEIGFVNVQTSSRHPPPHSCACSRLLYLLLRAFGSRRRAAAGGSITGRRVEELTALTRRCNDCRQRCARARLPLPAKASSCSRAPTPRPSLTTPSRKRIVRFASRA